MELIFTMKKTDKKINTKSDSGKNKPYLYAINAVMAIAFFFAWLFFYAVPARPTTPFWVVLGLFAASLITLIVIDFERIKDFLQLRAFHRALTSIVILIGIIAFLITLYLISGNFPMRFDVTKDNVYSISEQTVETLKMIEKPLRIIVFRSQSEDPNSAAWRADLLLEEYSTRNNNIKVEYVNPDQQPILARQYEMSEYGQTVFIYDGGKRSHVLSRDIIKVNYGDSSEREQFVGEQMFTQAIYTLLEEKKYNIYFVTGHGEKQINDQGQFGLSLLKTYLESENYNVDSINTLTMQSIPANASLLIIAGPTSTFMDEEKALFSQYVANGGRILVLYDSAIDGNKSNLHHWLEDYGFLFHEDFVIDVDSSIMIPVNVVPQYNSHPIVEDMRKNNVPSSFIVARSIVPVRSKYDGVFSNILFTSKNSYGKIEPTFDISRAKFTPGVDIPGPVSLAMIGIYTNNNSGTQTNDGMIAVYGDAHFALNGYVSVQSQTDIALVGNKDLILNTIGYMLGSEKNITIRPKEYDTVPLNLTITQSNLIVLLVQLALPFIFAVVGVAIWFRRRKT